MAEAALMLVLTALTALLAVVTETKRFITNHSVPEQLLLQFLLINIVHKTFLIIHVNEQLNKSAA